MEKPDGKSEAGDKAPSVKSRRRSSSRFWAGLTALNPVKSRKPTGDLAHQFYGNRLPLLLRVDVFGNRFKDRLTKAIERERALGTLFHFAPFVFALGIALYYLLPSEPVLLVLLATSGGLILPALLIREHGRLWLTICVMALFFSGLSAGKIRSDVINNQSLVHRITGQIEGVIVEVTRNRRGAPRYLIAPLKIEKLSNDELPTFIRLSAASRHVAGKPGELIAGLARLQPVSGPPNPGGYDFSFNSWHNGLGGTGFFMGKPQIKPSGSSLEKLTLPTRFTIVVNNLRTKITARIKAALPGEGGDVAVALIVGDRTGISSDTQVSLRSSGIAHVLAISGMHMALVSLTMVWAVRFLLALNSNLASTRPIKNWAAIAGFITATSYLLISGMSVATQRAWIMISVMILAAILSRKSITLRGVALAAMVILAIQPESLVSPGFQMSFAAVAAIVAAYEWLDERKTKTATYRRPNRLVRFFVSLMFTSFIAGLATSLFAAYHFHRVAPLGVLTNLLAMPLVSTIVMPMGLLSALLMPYGLEQLTLVPMGFGIEKVIGISNYVNSLYVDYFGGNGVTGQLGAPVLPLTFIGLFLLTMLKTTLRLSGVVLLISSIFFWPVSSVPDILLSEDGRAIAIKGSDGKLAMLYPRRNKFVRNIWLRAYSDDQQGKITGGGECNKEICSARTLEGALVYVVYDPDLLSFACGRADILLAPKLRWVNCRRRKPELIIKRGDLEEHGSVAIYLDKMPPINNAKSITRSTTKSTVSGARTGFYIAKVETAIKNSDRPWNRHRKGRAAYLQD